MKPVNSPRQKDDLEFFSLSVIKSGTRATQARGYKSNRGNPRISNTPDIKENIMSFFLNMENVYLGAIMY
jgi:hypothetical protein